MWLSVGSGESIAMTQRKKTIAKLISIKRIYIYTKHYVILFFQSI